MEGYVTKISTLPKKSLYDCAATAIIVVVDVIFHFNFILVTHATNTVQKLYIHTTHIPMLIYQGPTTSPFNPFSGFINNLKNVSMIRVQWQWCPNG